MSHVAAFLRKGGSTGQLFKGRLDHGGVGLMHNQVVPTHFDGRMPGYLFEPEQMNLDELCTGELFCDSYF